MLARLYIRYNYYVFSLDMFRQQTNKKSHKKKHSPYHTILSISADFGKVFLFVCLIISLKDLFLLKSSYTSLNNINDM